MSEQLQQKWGLAQFNVDSPNQNTCLLHAKLLRFIND